MGPAEKPTEENPTSRKKPVNIGAYTYSLHHPSVSATVVQGERLQSLAKQKEPATTIQATKKRSRTSFDIPEGRASTRQKTEK